jgi:hypothetical protein
LVLDCRSVVWQAQQMGMSASSAWNITYKRSVVHKHYDTITKQDWILWMGTFMDCKLEKWSSHSLFNSEAWFHCSGHTISR